MLLKFKILGIYSPKQSFKFTKTGIRYQPRKLKEDKINLRSQIINQLPKNFKPFANKVELIKLWFHFPPVKSFNRKIKKMIDDGNYIIKCTRPDYDNLLKGVIDAMIGVVFLDDNIIWRVQDVAKVYSNEPKIEMIIKGE